VSDSPRPERREAREPSPRRNQETPIRTGVQNESAGGIIFFDEMDSPTLCCEPRKIRLTAHLHICDNSLEVIIF